MNTLRICLVPRVSGVGGMVSFQRRLTEGLTKRGIEVCFDLNDTPYAAVLVIGGSRQLLGLWRARRQGVRVVQRLNGMNWLHRVRYTGAKHFIRSEMGNLLLALIRARIAHQIVYQSEFARRWWEQVYGETRVPHGVIYNGVNLDIYTPEGERKSPEGAVRLLMVEGNLMGGYEHGLGVGLNLVKRLGDHLTAANNFSSIKDVRRVELVVAGRVSESVRRRFENALHERDMKGSPEISLRWLGVVLPERIPEIDRSAHLLFSADVNSACPNSVIEAIACGTPVVGFATGALPEIISEQAGRVVPYGGNPWRLEPPNVADLARASVEILENLDDFRIGARARAESMFGLDHMVEAYLQVLLER